MVFLQSVSSLLATTTTTTAKKKESPTASVVVENSPKRRKYQDAEEEEEEEDNEDDDDDRFFLTKMPKIARVGATDAEIGLEDADDPLPLEWQQCLDIKSGEIHFYNTKTNKRTFQDPRAASAKRLPAVGGAPCLSLDLKLNLASSDAAPVISQRQQHLQRADGNHGEVKVDDYKYCSKSSSSRRRRSSWISVDADQVEEMVAAVCVRCHMLVMMCKATPSCPNCKFVHPPPARPI